LDEAVLPLLLAATEELSDHDAAELHADFLRSREEAIIQEIRRVCGITQVQTSEAEETAPDDDAEDVRAGNGAWEEAEVEALEMDFA
jgi:hypothetical protein